MEKTFTFSQFFLKLAILPLLLLIVNSEAYSQTTYYDNYSFRIPLTLNNASLGTSTDQTNFVALLKVVSPNFVYGVCTDKTNATASIPPFAVVDSAYSTASELNYQIENYDSTTGTIYFWVKIPTLYKTGSANGSNKLYCYFGSTGTPSVTHNTAWQKLTWSSVTATAGINYSGVWHFNESPSGAAPQFTDATVNNNNLSSGSTGTVTQNTASQIGNGITLSSTSVLDIGATGMPNTNASQSLSIWASYPAIPTTTANLIVLENSSNPATTGNGTQLGVLVNAGVTNLQTWRWANRTTPLVKYATPPTANAWHHYVYTYDATANKSYLYVDGALIAGPTIDTSNPPFSGTVDMVSFGDYINNNIGGSGLHTVGGQSYTGTMDEAHVIGTTLTADWVKAEYVNQKNPDAFTTSGAMQTNSVRASSVAGYLVYTWKGVNTDITNANNWNNTTSGVANEAPVNSNVSWVIPAGLSNYPILTTNTGAYGVTIASGANINLSGFTLSVGCNIYNSSGGQILYSSNNNSKITWNGSIPAQYYYGTNTALTAQVGAMEVNNSSAGTVNISGGPLDIFNLLTITKGSLAVGSSPAALTLKSTSAQTANVAAVPSACSITGNVNVERFIQGSATSTLKRGYRLISSAVYTGSENGSNVFDLKYLLNNVYVSGLNETANGFNVTTTNNATLYIFREDAPPPPSNSTAFFTQYNWKGIAKINNTNAYDMGTQKRLTTTNLADTTTTIPIGNGVLFYFRGNNTTLSNGTSAGTKLTSPFNFPEDVTVTQAGSLNTGTINIKLWFANAVNNLGNNLSYTVSNINTNTYLSGGYTCVGNPYASTINWEKFNRNGANSSIYGGGNLPSTIWVFNEANNQYEAYMPKTTITSAADTTTSINPGTAVGSASNMIASGQGFFVVASAVNSQTLSFRETAKTTTQPASATLHNLMGTPKPTYVADEPLIRIRLLQDSIHTDEIVIRLNNKASTAYSVYEDAEDIGGSGALVSLSALSSDSVQLAIDRLPFPQKAPQIISLFTDASSSGSYQLKLAQLANLPPTYQVLLRDSFQHDSADMRIAPVYNFNIDKGIPATFGNNRFHLVIRQDPSFALRLISFNAAKTTSGSLINWKVTNESAYTTFYVERSIDNGQTFASIGSMQSDGTGNYTFLDKKPVTGTNQYRLQLLDINGNLSYSQIVTLTYPSLNDRLNVKINVFPNPTANIINLAINPDSKISSYNIRIVNAFGMVVKESVAEDATWHANVSSLKPGAYIVQVTNNKDKSLVGIANFVKN